MEIARLTDDNPAYPVALKSILGKDAPPSVAFSGNLDILLGKKLALFCSARCPGKLILETYDLAQNLKDAGITIIGGFHSPIERE